jgi:hypothetical protein
VRGKANAARILAFLGGFSLAIGLDLRLHELLGVRGDQSRHWCACRVHVACCCAPSGQECLRFAKWVVEAVYIATMSLHVYPLAREWKADPRRSLNHFWPHLGFIFGILSTSFITAAALQ